MRRQAWAVAAALAAVFGSAGCGQSNTGGQSGTAWTWQEVTAVGMACATLVALAYIDSRRKDR
jgi:hypothetical protein